jgi:hypothetical protein
VHQTHLHGDQQRARLAGHVILLQLRHHAVEALAHLVADLFELDVHVSSRVHPGPVISIIAPGGPCRDTTATV